MGVAFFGVGTPCLVGLKGNQLVIVFVFSFWGGGRSLNKTKNTQGKWRPTRVANWQAEGPWRVPVGRNVTTQRLPIDLGQGLQTTWF